jgi:branched-chain amino acid transport system substrate-binding protein
LKKRSFTGTKVFISLLALVLIVSLFVSACTAKTSTTTTQTSTSTTTTQTSTTTTKTSTTTAAQKVLKIGAVIDMTGARGLQVKRWYDLMAKLYNDAGGWKIGNDTYKVEMVIYNTQGDMTTAKNLLTRAVLQDGVKYIIGWATTGSPDVDATVTEANKVIVINEDLTNQAAKTAQYFYTTGNFFTGAFSYILAANLAKAGYKSYLSVKPENQVGHTMDTSINASWAMGAPAMKWVGTVWVDPATIDYAPVATKVKSLNAEVADLMYLGYIPNAVPQIYRALYDVGYKGLILPGLMSQADLDALVVQVGKAAVEGGIQSSMGLDYRLYNKDPRMISIMAAYEKEYGKYETDGQGETTHFFMLEAAINATQSVDVDVIKAYLDNKPPSFRTLSGWTTLLARADAGTNRTTVCVVGGPCGMIRDGKVVPGYIITPKDSYLFTIISQKLGDAYKAYWNQYGYPTFPAEFKQYDTLLYTQLGITGQD